jgi:uroporphyrinogen-III synthase
VLVTRPRGVADPLVMALRQADLRVVAVPTVITVPALPNGPLDALLTEPDGWDWIVATSAAGAIALAEAARRTRAWIDVDGNPCRAPRLAAIGPATTSALEDEGLHVHLEADVQTGAGLASAIATVASLPGLRVLLARADAAGRDLPAALCSEGAAVTEVTAYHTIEAPAESLAPLADVLRDDDLAAGVVASGSAVRGLLTLADASGLGDVARRLPLISIGPTTSAAVRMRRCALAAEAPSPTVDGLVHAVLAALDRAEPREPRSSQIALR